MINRRFGAAGVNLSARDEYTEKMFRLYDRLKFDESIQGDKNVGHQLARLLNRLEGLPSPVREREFVKGCIELSNSKKYLRLAA